MAFLPLFATFMAFTLGSTIQAAPVVDGNTLLKMIQSLQYEVKELKTRSRIEQKEVEELRKDNAELRHAVKEDAFDTRITLDSMFLATLNTTTFVQDEAPIIWDLALINPGGYFETENGGYTAPVNGYYTFSVSKKGTNENGSFFFVVDEVIYAAKEEVSGSFCCPSGSASINMELTAGQVVRIFNINSRQVYGQVDGILVSWFTGHLLYAL